MQESHKLSKTAYMICFSLLTAVIAFLCFYKLGVKYVDPWDEARHGVNAYEMLHGGSMFQNTYRRVADYYNLKPPLSMWGIMIGLLIFPDPVTGLRFYSAVCYIIIAVIVALYIRRIGDLESLFALAALCLNITPFSAHMIRAGDADCLYCLFFTIAMLVMSDLRKHPERLWVCGLCFSLAFLTKSFHSFLIPAIIFVFMLVRRLILKVKPSQWAALFAAAILPAAVWAFFRLRIDGTAFFVKMWETDVVGRTEGVLKSNPSPFWYYLSYYFGPMTKKVTVYLVALILAVFVAVYYAMKRKGKDGADKATVLNAGETSVTSEAAMVSDTVIAFILWAVIPFAAFSAVSNKLLWYVYPSLIPLLAGTGALCGRLFWKFKKTGRVILSIVLAAVFIWYGAGTFHVINAQGSNDFQLIVRAVCGDKNATEKLAEGNFDNAVAADGTDTTGNSFAPETPLHGIRAYVDHDESVSVWSQQDVFVAEAYGDLECVDGGIVEVFAGGTDSIAGNAGNSNGGTTGDSGRCVVFVAKSIYDSRSIFYEDAQLIAESGEYLAFLF